MLSILAPSGIVAWPQSKLSSCACIAIVPADPLLCEALPYTASRVPVLLCKVVIPKPGSLYVTWKHDTSYQLLLWRQRLPDPLGCMQKQTTPKQQVTDCITGSLSEETTVFIMTWWYGEEEASNGKCSTWMDRSWSPVFLQGHNYETFSIVSLLKFCLILTPRHNLVNR